ncbi:MAG: BlaI/MecI/CopY family transcriptional regulator [Sarcina sp.]
MYKLGETEEKFATIIWDNEPISSGNLVLKCTEILDWKKSTTYTVLKKLSVKGFFKNENSIVTSIITKNDYEKIQSKDFIDNSFSGSLPKFLTAFMSGRKLKKNEILEIQNLIDLHSED